LSDHETYRDDAILRILRETRTIAMVGASANPARPSNGVLHFLVEKGYRVFPVNPAHAGKEIAGQRVYARLSEVPEPVDLVDIFRRPDAVSGVVDEALLLRPLPKTIWMQLGIRDDAAAARAEIAGLTVIMNRCLKIEYGRLMSQADGRLQFGVPDAG
jgi:predicted CoA-binding protein